MHLNLLIKTYLHISYFQKDVMQLTVKDTSEEVKSLSRVQLFATPWTVAYQAPPSMGFSRQEYWSGVSLPSLAMQELLLLLSCYSRVRLCVTP